MEFELKTPLNEKVADLKIGDVVYLTGTLYTARDRAHNRIIENGSPYSLEGAVIFHAGPIIKMNENSDKLDAEMIAVGPTTSTRMNPFEPEVLDMGVKAIIGKGGMDDNTKEALIRNNAVFLAAVGGCAALYVNCIKKVKGVDWLDLGVPEAMWQLDVEKFGPLVVAMDSNGETLYAKKTE